MSTELIIQLLMVLLMEVVIMGIFALISGIKKTKYHKIWRLSFLLALGECMIFFLISNYMNNKDMFLYGKTIPRICGILAIIIAIIPISVPYFDKQYRKEYLPSTAEIRENERRLLDEKILKTRYMSGDTVVTSKLSTSSAVGRAVVGNAIAGDVGAIVGASTAKQKTKEKHTTTFLVFYKDGHKNLETVEDGTLQFEVYVDKLEIE